MQNFFETNKGSKRILTFESNKFLPLKKLFQWKVNKSNLDFQHNNFFVSK